MEQARAGDTRLDALVRLRAPDRNSALLLVEAKRLLATRDVPAVLEQLARARDQLRTEESAVPMLVARYLAPSTRERLEEPDAAYADATGNVWITLEKPALFLRDVGTDRDPWRGPGRPRGTLKGPPAARVVRSLIDYAPPVTVPELVKRSRASTGATYRVVQFLGTEALIERAQRGPIVRVDWRRLIQRWGKDYSFLRSNTTASYLAPRGFPALLDALRSVHDLRYVLTGSLAAQWFAPYAPPRLAMVYVDRLQETADLLGLRRVETGANVLLAAGDYDIVFERARERDALRIAAPSQVAVDLITGPGRSPAEATALLDWMETNETEWRL